MKYVTPDGYEMISQPYPKEVSYKCEYNDENEGIFESLETMGDITPIGIKQLHIKRQISNGILIVTIRESNEQELQEYINQLK